MAEWGHIFALVAVVGMLVSCGSSAREDALFSLLSPDSTGITFVNRVEDRPERNVLNFEYLYNGGGVAVGDVNGDGWPDLYFSANSGVNELYLNQGNFQFKEVTEKAGVGGMDGWTTGVTMADVNGDGLLDIYVCKSGPLGAEHRHNRLYINQGSRENGLPQFKEEAGKYGLDDPAYSTHATFFDYDRDGDLDLYLLNNPPVRDPRVNVQPTAQQRRNLSDDKLYRNDTDSTGAITFVDVTEKAKLKDEVLGYGLSATVSDVNKDGWPDIYVANDFYVEDRLYINQGDGTFVNNIHGWIDHMSRSSMGSDIADYNNDGRPDIFVLDMLAESNRRQKLLNVGQRPTRESNQYVRNTLHLHNGNGTFSEIGQLADVSNTDWSWAALLADFNLDGFKDLYITNGVRYDYTNMDFQYSKYLPALRGEEEGTDLYDLIDKIPSTPMPNYVFRNEGDLTFEKVSKDWGVAQKGFSGGAAYADFDRDGDLDLAVNNLNESAWIYRNNTVERTAHHFLRVELEGTGRNRFGIGAKITIKTPEGRTFFQEMMPARGFQSSVEPALTFGLDTTQAVDVTVTWPDQTQQRVSGVRANQTITLYQKEAKHFKHNPKASPEQHLERKSSKRSGLVFTHQENSYRDYRQEPLLPHMLSRSGPALARGDVDGDGREDVFVGGARGQSSALFLQRPDGSFSPAPSEALYADRNFEDVAATFFDADGDGDQDLYVVSGGASEVRAEAYQDRLYLNDGTGTFEGAPEALPPIESSGGAVAAHDYDGDGDVDLFVGGRVRPMKYPMSPRSYLLKNEDGHFRDVTGRVAEGLRRPGMVTDAQWHDLSGDGIEELVLTGEWMPIRIFRRDDSGGFTERTETFGLGQSSGWWYSLEVADFDGDGDTDLVAGNRGVNAQVRAQPGEPASIYAGDFDRDGGIEPIMSHYINGTEYPVPRRDRLIDELSLFRARFRTYESYAEATMDQVLTQEQLQRAKRLTAHTFTTSLFEQQGGRFVRRDLPMEAQFSPVRDLGVRDVNGDERPDVLLAGNDFTVRRPWGPSDAGQGALLINKGNLAFEAQRAHASGFFAPGDVRSLLLVPTPGVPLIVVGNNDASVDLFELNSSSQGIVANGGPQ